MSTPAATTTPNDEPPTKKTRVENQRVSSLDPIRAQQVTHTGEYSVCHDNNVIYRNSIDMDNFIQEYSNKPIKIAGFNLNGTLFDSVKNHPSDLADFELWNLSVIEKLRRISDEGFLITLFINQGQIRGAVDGKRASKLKDLIEYFCSEISRPVAAFISTNTKSGFHKPSTNMWEVMIALLGFESGVDMERSYFVGDSVDYTDDKGVDRLGDDSGFASGLGICGYIPQDFFGSSNKEMRLQMDRDTSYMASYEIPSEEVLHTRAALHCGYLTGPILLLLCGPQGSGKSYFCNELCSNRNQYNHWVCYSQDAISKTGKPGTRKAVERRAKDALAQGKSVIIDRMHLDPMQRSHFLKLGQLCGVPVHCLVLTTPKDIISERVLKRENHPGNVQGEQGARMAANSHIKLVIPKYEEGFSLISATGTPDGVQNFVSLYHRVRTHLPDDMMAATEELPSSFSLHIPSATGSISLPSVALGTYRLGRKIASDTVATAKAFGVHAVDTAPTYNNEDCVGEGLLSGDMFFIVKVPKRATKGSQVNEELSRSLSKLKKLKANLLLLHWPCDVIKQNTLKEVWAAMEDCVKDGRVDALGVCNFNVNALRILLPLCESVRPTVLQTERHFLLPQWDIVDFCACNDILIQAHSPLGQGRLIRHEIVRNIATKRGLSHAQVLIQWNLVQNTAVVTKCSSKNHMKDIAGALTLSKTEGQLTRGLTQSDMKILNSFDREEDVTRFLQAPFMVGDDAYCWSKKMDIISSGEL